MNEFVKIRSDIDDEAAKKLKKLIKTLSKSEDELVERVAAIIVKYLDDDGGISISDPFIAEVEDGVVSVLTKVNEQETEFMHDVLEDGYLTAHDKTASAIGMGKDWNLLRKEFVAAALATPIDGANFSDRVWKNTNDLANRIYADILDCVRTGRRPNEITRKIRDDFGVSAYEAARLVNTELARVVNTAQLDIYRNSGVVDTVMWTATLESNTCERCAELDGQTFALDKAPNLPMHPNCRCCLVPMVDDWTPTKRADNETKKNITYTTYQEWKKNK